MNNRKHNLELVHAFWDESTDDELQNELDKILKPCTTRAEKYAKIAELCIPGETNEELYFISKSYVFAGAAYRQEAIKYLEKYIAAGAFWDGLPDGTLQMEGYIFNQKAGNISSTYTDLGNCYDGEGEFDKAIECYEKAYSLTPYSPANIIKISESYVKKNNLEKALSILKNATECEYYKNESFSSSIDRYILDIEEKIKKGYVYKPRKRK